MARILPISDRIKLFKEINRVHRETYGWNMIYENAWNGGGRINIDRDVRIFENDIPMSNSEIEHYYFCDSKGEDINALKGLFSWQACYFYHVNPYKVLDLHSKLSNDDFVVDSLGKRLKPDAGSNKEGVECLETRLVVQQCRRDGMVWISTSWLFHEDCYSSVSPFGDSVFDVIREAAGGDKKIFEKLWKRYERANEGNINYFRSNLERYFRGKKLRAKCWDGGYVFAASKNWIIKTTEQLKDAMEMEEGHFSIVLEEFVEWFRKNGIDLGEDAEQRLREQVRKLYESYPKGKAKQLCDYLVDEDKAQPSDVYLWWGGEPESLPCYAFLTLFFEIDPEDIGTSEFEDRVSRNLPILVKIAEKENIFLSRYREYRPRVWRAIFSS